MAVIFFPKYKMTSENVIHIRLEYGEALGAKRGILASEINSLQIAKIVGRYKALRMAELGVKNRIYTRMKETKANIRKLQVILPVPKVPRIIKRVHKEEMHATAIKPTPQSEDIESQLSEIQRRLNSLQRENR